MRFRTGELRSFYSTDWSSWSSVQEGGLRCASGGSDSNLTVETSKCSRALKLIAVVGDDLM